MGPARLIQATGLLDSIIAQEARAADFCNTIGRKADMPNQRVECPLLTLSGRWPSVAALSLHLIRRRQ